MAVGELMCAVVDVNDLAVAEQFWSAVTGWPSTLSHWNDQYSEVGDEEASLLLQLVPETKTVKNRIHLDFRVKDVAKAVDEVTELGGAVVKPPGFTRTWGSNDVPADAPDGPTLEWAVVADPFGNEFCLIRLPTSATPSSTPTTGQTDT
jgi:predicted enzyme related to lactoylglutathione lyase